MGGYQGFYENIPFPVTRTMPTDGAAARRLLADDDGQRHADPHLRPGDDALQRQLQLVHAAAVSGQRHSGEPLEPDREGAAAVHPAGRTRRRATSSGSSNFISSPNLGRYRYNSYLTRIDHVFSNNAPAVVQQHRQLGHRVPQRERAAGAGDPQRQLPDAPEPLPRDGGRQRARSTRRTLWNTRVLVGPVRRAARQAVYGDVDPKLPFTGPVPADRAAVPADQHRRLRGHVPADVPPAEERRLLGQHDAVEDAWAGTSRRWAASSAPTSSTARTRSTRTASFGFNNDFTRRDPLNNTGAASGNGFATFLLGLPTSGSVATGTPRTEQYRYYALYRAGRLEARLARDAQRRPALGLPAAGHREGRPDGLGLRLQRRPTRCSRSCRRARRRSTRRPASRCILKGGLLFANHGGPKSPYKSDWNNIQPRVGFTYKINDWLVARANYGRSYLGLSSGGQDGVYTTDFQRTTPFIATAPNGVDPGHAVGDAVPGRLPASRSPASWDC